jgi:hypothetical protein
MDRLLERNVNYDAPSLELVMKVSAFAFVPVSAASN